MYRKLIFCSLCAAIPWMLSAAPAADSAKQQPSLIFRGGLNPAGYVDRAAAEKLLTERKALILKMHEKRMELIKKDPKLKRLHDQITALHRELAIELDSKRDMMVLNSDLKSIDSRIDSLPKK